MKSLLMSELAEIFERLELSQYLENFLEEGFTSWDTVLYITESDLERLNVRLGHRRRLQLEIAHARQIPFEQLLSQSGHISATLTNPAIDHNRSEPIHPEGRVASAPIPTKRKYRRHPKVDDNAPERPPSAYVIFSNQVREELKPQKLSFTEIAKTVGERWQSLPPEQKEPYETQAAVAKEAYNQAMAEYKKTDSYWEYMKYLADFKAKNAPQSGDGKRSRVEKETSRGSSAGSPMETIESPTTGMSRPLGPPSVQSTSPPSISSTPLISSYSPPSASPTGMPAPRPQLPRIIPMEPRDSSMNSRRTAGGPAASLLRHDTSRSSVSSNISGGSTGSSVFTPITPIDEHRSRAFQPPHPSSSSSSLDRRYPLPPLSQSVSHESVSGQIPPQSPQFSGGGPMKRLSLSEDERNDRPAQRPRSNPPEIDILMGREPPPLPPHPGHDPLQSHHSRSSHSQSRPQDRLDALSVLALAGNMMDRRTPDKDRDRDHSRPP